MGMYTGLRARVKIRKEYRDAIQKLHDGEAGWDNITDKDLPNAEKWKLVDRYEFIPFGVVAYMPSDFGEPFGSHGGSEFDGEWWTFSCSLKNYDDQIQTFVESILMNIVEEIDYCQRLFEDFISDVDWDKHCTNYFWSC